MDEEHRLNEQLIKDITGGDTIEGRRLYQEAFTFKPQFKPWMYGNHKPEIRGTDDAIWSRVRLIPFEVSFKGREDLHLPDKLEAELPGILNWAIRGCLDWQRHGLRPPAKVQAATQAYRDEMDMFGPFIAECCVVHQNTEVWANDLLKAYKAWCADNGEKEQSQHKLGRYLTAKGYHAENLGGRIKRLGIGLKPRHEDYEDYDLTSRNPLMKTSYSDFLEKGHKGHKGHEASLTMSPAPEFLSADAQQLLSLYEAMPGLTTEAVRERLNWSLARIESTNRELLLAHQIEHGNGGWHLVSTDRAR